MTVSTDWLDINRGVLQDALARVRGYLQDHVERTADAPRAEAQQTPIGPESALGLLQQIFELTPFETDIVVLCAGVELDASLPPLCAAASGDPNRGEPTFSLVLAALPSGHWSALVPDGPLRRWRLVEPVPVGGPATLLTHAPLRIDERILHFLVGLDTPDTGLLGRITRMAGRTEPLPGRHETLARQVAQLWAGPVTVVQLVGDQATSGEIATRAAAMLGWAARELDAATVPSDATERAELFTLVNRDGMLGGGPLVVRVDPGDPHHHGWLRELLGPVAVAVPAPLLLADGIALDIAALDTDEQAAVWRTHLRQSPDVGDATDVAEGTDHTDHTNGTDIADIAALADQFNLSSTTIRAAAAQANATGASAWSAARAHARHGMESLATCVETTATWADLVLPAAGEAYLREITATVRHRRTVYRTWGLAPGSTLRGMGVSALFAGPSGTGKTLAAEVIAGALELDLYRIDLSQIVSKYIGETEKNLRAVFDAADAGGCVLLFDEADALFGKRSEVRDSHDRYANLEVSYLLQRMEAYRGLAILTTNLRDNIDKAFLRRLTAIVTFPFPDLAERVRIWRRMLVPTLPTEGLAIDALARLAVTGGVIRNIVLGAAFLAAEEGAPVRMTHLLAAAQRECAKLDRPLSHTEVGDWV
jgi:hypothetical protein